MCQHTHHWFDACKKWYTPNLIVTLFVGKAIKSSSTVELLGITLDKNSNFKSHIENIYCKANKKIKALF